MADMNNNLICGIGGLNFYNAGNGMIRVGNPETGKLITDKEFDKTIDKLMKNLEQPKRDEVSFKGGASAAAQGAKGLGKTIGWLAAIGTAIAIATRKGAKGVADKAVDMAKKVDTEKVAEKATGLLGGVKKFVEKVFKFILKGLVKIKNAIFKGADKTKDFVVDKFPKKDPIAEAEKLMKKGFDVKHAAKQKELETMFKSMGKELKIQKRATGLKQVGIKP